ncbi:hypothetical protein [Aequorivita marina]|uniref:hypothetical protein n=1 Tax=Aequorivita marina TaxID=3073654 RepID=UPI002873F82D|nr:hypothetical protein [Aequorivita sp. S2608]MDS1297449.1 hypothetical protein [Aequorivita sp. S2608]
MIKKYRNQKLRQLIFGIIWLVWIGVSVDSHIIQTGLFAFLLFIGIVYSTKLLTNIKKSDGFYSFETYSVIIQKETIKISESQLVDLQYYADSFFKSYNLVLKYDGTNGVITKKLYLNAGPHSELRSEINRIRQTINAK